MLAATDPIFSLATMFKTSSGSATTFPILTDEGSSSAVVAEGGTSAADDVPLLFAGLAFGKCPSHRSGLIFASVELVFDSAFDFEALLAAAAGIRFARGAGALFIATLLGSAALGVTAATGAIAGAEVFSLIDALDDAYAPGACFLMRRATFTALSKLVGSSGNFLFPATFDAQGRPVLAGFPVFISPSMPALGASAKTIDFGDHSRFIRRQVRDSLRVAVFPERRAEFSQIRYQVFLRVDGDLAKSTTACPVVYLQQHS
jgi:HK97 family phage major capsid protein